MKVYDELVARGLIAQVTNEEEIREMVDNGKATFYIGFDPTADSLHVGHFMALCLMKRLQMAGNKPIALIGGGTTMIGDPSGRTDMRKMLTKEDIEHNAALPFSGIRPLHFTDILKIRKRLIKGIITFHNPTPYYLILPFLDYNNITAH